MPQNKKKVENLKQKKQDVNNAHIEFYDKTLDIIGFILDEYSKELTRADIDFLEMPKNALATLDFLVSSITRVQKGHRLALGLDDQEFEDTSPQINIIEGVTESKI
jgi:hypothetical protein